MSWKCPECRSMNEDLSAICPQCGFENEEMQMAQKPKELKSSENHVKWVIVCPSCGRRVDVDDENAEIEICPNCGDDSIETQNAVKVEVAPAQTTEQSAPLPRLFIREIKAVPEQTNNLIYHQKGRTPDYISNKIEILPPVKEFGREDLPKSDYYKTISQKHCKFRLNDNGDWLVSDMKSLNGTRVDGRRLVGGMETELKNDGEIQIADKVFVVFIE